MYSSCSKALYIIILPSLESLHCGGGETAIIIVSSPTCKCVRHTPTFHTHADPAY